LAFFFFFGAQDPQLIPHLLLISQYYTSIKAPRQTVKILLLKARTFFFTHTFSGKLAPVNATWQSLPTD